MKTKIINAHVLTMDGYGIENGTVLIEDSNIIFVGKETEVEADKTIDAKGKVLMPGFVNAHAHSAMSILKNVADSVNLSTWLNEHMWPLEMKLNDSVTYHATYLAIAEYVKSGITCFADMYQYHKGTLKAIEDSGIRASVCLGLHPVAGVRTPEEIEQEYLKYNYLNESINFNFYVHSIYANELEDIEKVIALAKKHNVGIFTHMSETLDEVSDCTVKNNGLTPPKLMEELGLFDLPATVAHAVHVDSEDIEVLKEYNVNVVSCPASNLKLGSGIAPLNALRKAEINLSLGTDGAASNNSLNMFREMYLASVLQKAQLRDASVMEPGFILKMATVNGAKALNFDSIGKIKEGYKADLILLDLNKIETTPINNVKNTIVYSASPNNVYLTMVNGKVLYEDGKLYINKTEEEILENAKWAINELKRKS